MQSPKRLGGEGVDGVFEQQNERPDNRREREQRVLLLPYPLISILPPTFQRSDGRLWRSSSSCWFRSRSRVSRMTACYHTRGEFYPPPL